jgi:hypothetical protein
VVHTLSSIQGPFACAFWQPASRKLWFARDSLGRRSMVLGLAPHGTIVVSSIAAPDPPEGLTGWWELRPGVYSAELTPGGVRLQRYPWVAGSAQASRSPRTSPLTWFRPCVTPRLPRLSRGCPGQCATSPAQRRPLRQCSAQLWRGDA